jgi:hypothetical protein
MKNSSKYSDDFLRSIVRKTTPEKAPAGFTDRVMEKVSAEPGHETVTSVPFISGRTWLLVAAGFIGLIWFLFFSNWSILNLNFSPEKMDVKQYEQVLNYFKTTFDGILSFFSFFAKSRIPLIVILGAGSLVLIDRLLRRVMPNKTSIF